MNKKPKCYTDVLDSGSNIVRFNSFEDLFYYDNEDNNPRGLGKHNISSEYLENRLILTPRKKSIIEKAKKELSIDKDFLNLVYKAKSDKRKYVSNKFGGSLNMVAFSRKEEKIFMKNTPGAKKSTLNMAFQVGTFSNGDYSNSFVKILKTILSAQALGIRLNIDMFDSDTAAINNQASYIITNIAKSDRKINLKNILIASHEEFFNGSLFNGYSAHEKPVKGIGTFLSKDRIIRDLGHKYDVIGGNILVSTQTEEGEEKKDMVSKLLKIASI